MTTPTRPLSEIARDCSRGAAHDFETEKCRTLTRDLLREASDALLAAEKRIAFADRLEEACEVRDWQRRYIGCHVCGVKYQEERRHDEDCPVAVYRNSKEEREG